MKVHLENGGVLCEICFKTFDKNYKLLHHKRQCHDERKFACEICNKFYSERGILAKHVRAAHTDVKREKVFHCEECPKAFSQKSHLNRHLKLTHKGEKSHLCEYCSKTFPQKSNLFIHMMRMHSEKNPGQSYIKRLVEKRFVCQYCGKKFPSMISLDVHNRTHTGERPFSCEFCGKSFTQKGQLLIHCRTHSGDKRFGCLECFKRFNTNHELIMHSRSHTKEKPFLCEYCYKTFGLQCNLIKHKKIYHLEKYFASKEEMKTNLALSSQEHAVSGDTLSCKDCSKSFCLESDLVSHVKIHVTRKTRFQQETSIAVKIVNELHQSSLKPERIDCISERNVDLTKICRRSIENVKEENSGSKADILCSSPCGKFSGFHGFSHFTKIHLLMFFVVVFY